MKIFLSGSSAAGKTNLRYSLLGQKFVEKHESTDIQETRHAYIANNAGVLETKEGKKLWREFNLQEQLNHFKSLWEYQLNQESENNSEHTIDDIPSEGIQSEDMPRGDIDLENLSEVRTEINKSQGLSKEIKIEEPVKLISMIDTGGQPGYIHMLPAIIHMLPDSKNCPTINLIVIDMTKSLNDQVLVRYRKKGQKDELKPYSLHYTNENLIKLLLSVTTDSYNTQRSANAQNPDVNIGFVGTHKDMLQNTEEIHIFDNQLSELVEHQKCRNITIKSIPYCKYLYPVSNKTPNDPVVANLRAKIESLLNDRDPMYIPINWMIVELAVKIYCESKKTPYITYQEFQDIARKEASIEEEEAENALRYFHSLGILLNFKEVPKMSSYIIVKHQWLYDQLSMLVTVSSENPTCSNGILLKSELPKIEMEGSIKMEHLISLLDHKKILASYTLENQQHYYLPFALPYCQKYHDKFKFLLLEPLLVRFSSGFLPRGFFCSLVVSFLQDMPDGWISSLHMNIPQHFRNVMTFVLPNDLYLRLQDKIDYLEIQVRHHQHCKPVKSMFKELEIICKHLFDVCKILKLDCNKLQFGFLCQHGKVDEKEHMPEMLLKPSMHHLKHLCRNFQSQTVVLPFMDGTSLFNLIYCEKCHNQIYCKKCQYVTNMGELHKLWFKEAKVNNLKS